LAVASCSQIQQVPSQPVWAAIQAGQPDALLLLGDTVYLDRDDHDDPAALAADLDRLYAAQRAEPHFAALHADLQARGAPLIAIYDDHDFLGDNRCGGDHAPALRDAARRSFVRAMAPRIAGAEVYRHEALGLVDLLVLDVRFHRRSAAASAHDRDALLGAAQWAWFEQALAACTAPYLVVASSTPLYNWGDECWEQYPLACQRLLALLKDRTGALFLSGDAHRNAAYDDAGVIEVVCSAVARLGRASGRLRSNHGLLSFDEQGVRVQLHARMVGWRFDFRIERQAWALTQP
jgi:phosphodiesterase/alkaline phosphatase D-like protein